MEAKLLECDFESALTAEYIRTRCEQVLECYENRKANSWLLSPISSRKAYICNKNRGNDGKYKRSYGTRKEAAEKAASIYEKRGVPLFEYKCDFCGNWHLSKRH
ncbi:hypothetical protein ACHSBP_19415 [Pseudoalteromonas sp. XMcav1-K]|uniref:hypothetical protein n=1 Tax=Pseudoalteromonas sp. XMcav1-K TaxID=3374372 RepID=UPI003756C507